jgi:hypothetical protein
MREKLGADWRKIHIGVKTFYSSPNIVRMIISMWMRWTRHVERMGRKRHT